MNLSLNKFTNYGFHTLRGDLYGGFTSTVVALPVALAFGVASGMGAAAGLYSAIAVGFFASLFGGTRCQISGPTGPRPLCRLHPLYRSVRIYVRYRHHHHGDAYPAVPWYAHRIGRCRGRVACIAGGNTVSTGVKLPSLLTLASHCDLLSHGACL